MELDLQISEFDTVKSTGLSRIPYISVMIARGRPLILCDWDEPINSAVSTHS